MWLPTCSRVVPGASTNLQVSVHYAILVTMIYTFYNLLYAVTVEKQGQKQREEREKVQAATQKKKNKTGKSKKTKMNSLIHSIHYR